jgi:hypothetical protein
MRELVEFYEKFVPAPMNGGEHLKGKKKTYIKIHFPGDRNTVVDRALKPEDKINYKRSWDAYMNFAEGSAAAVGLPIDQWPAIDLSTARMLQSHHVYTVENLAEMSDTGLQNVGPGTRALQNEAKAFLENTTSEVKALEKQVDELREMVLKLSSGEKVDKRTKVFKELVHNGEANKNSEAGV